MKLKKRIAALLMAGAMVCSTLPVNVLAVENSNRNVGGLCEHHAEHTEDCGYTEGSEGTPCNHEHTEDCYTLVTSCVHKHTADCYPAESVSDNTASPSDAENREPTECSHECSEDTGCIKKELDCKHEHDEACGYVPATEGRPCGYICGECDVEDEPETATPSNAAQLSAGDVQKLIDALPATDKLTTMTKDEQNAVYADLQAAYEAYQALTEDEQALLTGTEVFESLFHFFNGMVNLLAENGVSYLDKNGDEQTAENVTVVESSTTAWSDGWYVVNGAVTIGNRATVSGDVRLILEDGAVLTIEKGIQVQDDDRDPSNGSANQLTIYAQSDGENMGTLTANGNNGGAGIGGGDSGSGGNITINGGNVTATGGQYAAGIGGGNGGSGGTVTIHGGNVTASSGDSGAGIGGGYSGSGGTITINGGRVKANGGDSGAGIGSGSHGSYDTITINGGSVTATGGDNGAGIGGESGGYGGSFVTRTDGHALIVANGGISDKSNQNSWSGVIFEDKSGKVYAPDGDKTITIDISVTIPEGYTLEIPEGVTLVVPDGVTLTNNGTITVGGTLTGRQNVVGNGTVNIKADAKVSVSVTGTGVTGSGDNFSVPYGSNITLTATISEATNALTRAAANQVEFFVGTGNNKTSLGTVNVNGTSATKQITISGDTWKPGAYTITAEYGGSDTLKKATGSSALTVTAAKLSAPQNLTWDSTTPGKATWNAVTNANGYSVQLYKDGQPQGSSVSVTGTSQTFTITEAGSYTFKVKAKGTGNYADSSESAASSSLTFYAVTFETNGGTASGGGTFEENTQVTVTATPNSGYHFVRWTENGAEVSTSASYSFTLTADRTLTAVFGRNSSSGGGSSSGPYTPSTPSKPAAPNLDKTKTDSTTALNAAATANKYDAAEQAEVKKILDKANADIKNAKTEAEVKTIEEAAQAEIDKILTTEEKAIVAALDNVEKRDFKIKSKVITRKSGKKVIRLTWTAPDGVDVDGYEIFRSTKKNSGFGKKPYFTTSNTSYTNTKGLKAGKTYYYKVRAFVVINGERVYTDYSLKAKRKL